MQRCTFDLAIKYAGLQSKRGVDMWHESRQSWTSHRRSSFHENHASIPLGLARSTLNLTDVPWWFLILEGMDLCTNGRLFTEVTLWVRAGTAKRLQHPVFLDPWRQMPAIISFQIRAEGTCARAYCVRRFSSIERTETEQRRSESDRQRYNPEKSQRRMATGLCHKTLRR